MTAVADRTIDISLLQNSNVAKEFEIPESLTILNNPKDRPPVGCGMFRIMTPKDGDKRVVWNSNSFSEIKDAKDTFDKLVAEGLVPYKVGLDGKQTSEVMDIFDPHAEEILFLPIALVRGG